MLAGVPRRKRHKPVGKSRMIWSGVDDCRNVSPMAGLTAVFAVGFTPPSFASEFWQWLLKAALDGGLLLVLAVESRCRPARYLLKRCFHFELLQIRSLK